MAELMIMPKLGFDMAEGTLVHWEKAEGDMVTKGDLLAEIETDKATVEVESMFTGVVYKHLVPEHAIVPVGTPIAVISEEGEEVNLDSLVGSSGGADEKPENVEKVDTVTTPVAAAAPVPSVQTTSTPNSEYPGGVKATPVARRMAKDKGIDLVHVSGSGPDGRVMKKDVESFSAAPPASLSQETGSNNIPQPSEAKPIVPGLSPLSYSFDASEAETTVPLTRLRQAIAKRMTESRQQVPHFYVTSEYNVEALLKLRKEVNAMGGEVNVSVNDFILKAAALTLRLYPNLNASFSGDRLIQHGNVNVGTAVAVEGGLLTIVSKNTDRKPLRLISAEVKEMVSRARAGKVRPEDIEGSTFSVSNLGMFDVDQFVAIINPPESAILAVGSAKQEPVVVDGELTIGTRMKGTLSVDHRVSDGAEAAEFMQTLGKYLENPLSLLV
ncbi:MAG: 2-oxo acid dehydrogenase subunit E2 [Anaerolineales bacterium]|nr:2-oxo acid dehydrogenase subunit E2 [Anaerolineales bacterium]